ncbi:MAG: hypothetical protein CL910_09505 [Deltaproteobacteria bacterium]|jgi:PAS domain S-box-containing protein|nr:hypothetical protein [Deltaproteobacteria bacterium]
MAAGERTRSEQAALRVLIVEPPEEEAARQPGGVLDVASALRRLGREIQLEVHREPAVALRAMAGGHADLAVLDQALGDRFWSLLDAAGSAAAPALVVVRASDEAFALEAYRAGAADCVRVGSEFGDLLPIAALEQLRRVRHIRSKGAAARLGKRVDDLKRYNEHIIQNMNSALVVIDPGARVAYANPRAERVLGAEPGELEDEDVRRWFPGLPPEEILPLRTLEDGHRFRGAEMVLTRLDGALIPIGLSCSPLVDSEGVREGAVAIFQDLTEIKQLQRQVLQTEKMASIGQLAAGVAHEINNPMGFIHANLCQLSEYLDDLQKVWDRVDGLRTAARRERIDGDEVRRAAADLEAMIGEVDAAFLLNDFGTAIRESLEGSGRIREIVRDLRAFSHQDTTQRAPTDVNRALDSTAHIVWTMMRHSVVLTKHYEELPPVSCFPVQLQQVFMNLLVNAYQAIEARAEQEELRGEIQLHTEVQGEEVVVRVSDNGTGIDPQVLGRIFDPFFTTKQVGVGTGLGLSTSFNLVQQQGGSLHVDSEPGRGTTFEVRLPLGEEGDP